MTPANTNRFTPSLSRCSSLNSDGSAAARLHYSPLLNLSHSPSRFLCQFPFSSSKEEERGKVGECVLSNGIRSSLTYYTLGVLGGMAKKGNGGRIGNGYGAKNGEIKTLWHPIRTNRYKRKK
ncbi:hypothetical protein L1887_34945 [Cichorium endivia]|nr:hypothetical protein L1887_34945 [Cichorium endivia]